MIYFFAGRRLKLCGILTNSPVIQPASSASRARDGSHGDSLVPSSRLLFVEHARTPGYHLALARRQ